MTHHSDSSAHRSAGTCAVCTHGDLISLPGLSPQDTGDSFVFILRHQTKMRRYLWSKKRTKNVIVLTVMMTSVIMLVLGNSSELQLLKSDFFPSEISSLEDIREDLERISDDNPGFIKYVQNRLVTPALQNSSLRLHKSIQTGQIGQAEEVIKYFKGKSHGIFVEAGAFNGEYLSNTLYLEVNYNVRRAKVLNNVKRQITVGLGCWSNPTRLLSRVL